MIPLRDVNHSNRVPVVTYAIIACCVVAFLYELALGREIERFFHLYGLVPIRYTEPKIAAHFSFFEQVLPFFTSMFLHGGWLHLIGNMWTLYIFGDNVESALGRGRYFAFYVLCGLAAALIHLVTNLDSRIPTIGASGAIAGVMGAYFVLYPHARILALVPIFFFLQLVEVPAYVFLGFWFLIQFFSGTLSVLGGQVQAGGIAWWAHIGGFGAGVLLLRVFKVRRTARTIRPVRRWR
ncbi:rhomboid family intramembrane serine protease [Desulfoglaeba alkanexedens ALDC]|uniref:Rhomboid family intramembrane serine protease n=1 Tax=Desulfoglaeba alkanexedens ALDC TaxID=980445 RepID=A0A4P8L4M6_9BACT|nr:rhomboid family intramembrane serine protease [Desulfoglaeba alkanexedens ALDC]